MEPTYTFRNLDATDGLRDHAADKIQQKLTKYWFKPESAHIIMRVENDHEHVAEITLTDHGEQFVSHASSKDMYASIDLAVGKLEAQLRKKKDRHTHHKGHMSSGGISNP
jgi:putative sigma-54 modulation protein